MAATIYVSEVAIATMKSIAELSYYDRLILSDQESTDPTRKEGYFIKNLLHLTVAAIPDGAQIVMQLRPCDGAVSFPVCLRGCVFEHSTHLPADYPNIVRYWSGPTTVNSNAGGAAHYQNPIQAYDIDLSALEANPDLTNAWQSTTEIDSLLSEGVVVFIAGLGGLTADAPGDAFVEITLPIDDDLLGLDNSEFRTGKPYRTSPSGRAERIFLKVSEIHDSPDPERVYIDILRYEENDYGFFF